MKRRKLNVPVLVTLCICGIASACPMCKDSIPSSDAAQAGSLPGGFNTSVYIMLTSLIGVIGLVSGVIYKGITSTNNAARGFDVKPPVDPNP
jgi:hypothetical protein